MSRTAKKYTSKDKAVTPEKKVKPSMQTGTAKSLNRLKPKNK